MLRKKKQKPEENVQLYAERLLSLAEEAFTGQNGGVAAIERQLVWFFIDGLAHDNLKMKVMRENPATLQAAVASAMTEQNLRKRFNLRIGRVTDSNVRHIEPMEIDHLRPKKQCFKCNKIGHYAKDCHNRSNVNVVTSNGHNIEPMDIDYTQSRSHCFICNQSGHLARDCFNRSHVNAVMPNYPDGGVRRKDSYTKNRNFPNNRGNRRLRSKAHITCWNCREKGHYKNQCYAPPNGQNNGNASGN